MTDLTKYDIVLLLDKSGSMSTRDCPNGKSRWEYAQESTLALAYKCAEYDKDGITIIPFANTFKEYENTTPEKVAQIFKENEPSGGTDTAGTLTHVLNKYFANKQKPIIVVVITDVFKTIIDATNKMSDDSEIGISFIQVGKDEGVKTFLQSLDDGLEKQGAKFDIVDTKTMDEMENMTMTEALIQSLEG
jgi:uncharacterized protein with von Willebrand factor type A (vWA) domain